MVFDLRTAGDKLNWLVELDYSALHFLNVSLQFDWLDSFWLFITQVHKSNFFVYFLAPAILLAMTYIYRARIWQPILALAFAILLADGLSYRVLKKSVDRARPFASEATGSWVRQVGVAHGNSFPSNHAANCFAGAVVLAYFFRRTKYFVYTFACLVALSRVALGVHFPSDVLAGALLGFIVGSVVVFSAKSLRVVPV